jgi:hypothetical protein
VRVEKLVDKSVTLVIPIRDRDSWRIEKLVGSLRDHGGDPRVIVVDYGSSKEYSEAYAKIAHSLGIDYEKMHAEGRPWNKCHAINRGARLANSDYVCTADVDVYFATNPLPFCLGSHASKTMFHIYTYWLDMGGDLKSARPAGLGGPGGFQLLPRAAFVESGGYDERIIYWGQEDIDWPERLKRLGYEMIWLPEPHRIYHQWHPSPEAGYLRPTTASYNTMSYCVENKSSPVLAQDWGGALPESERPILPLLKVGRPVMVRFDANALMKYRNLVGLLETKTLGKFIKLDLGPRKIRRPLSSTARKVKFALRPITALVGLDCSEKINGNFDYLYAVLPALMKDGLRDYYISKDLSSVFLLWNN